MRVIQEVPNNPSAEDYGQKEPPKLHDSFMSKRVAHQHTRSISE